jgi:hypothetical protein
VASQRQRVGITLVSSFGIGLACVCCARALGQFFATCARVFVRASIASVARAMCRNVTTSSAVRLSYAGPHHSAFLQCVWCGTIVVKGRASVPPNRSFKADGFAAA